ncbi:hypothetical protein AAG747_25480 [Rapidithrix thailandica]|uniref:Lipocalin-like domain-containing protein n=1 Tax=Rapidithrix thailandica TaxID=413964 RepID=A0AAW9SFE6_9BACT
MKNQILISFLVTLLFGACHPKENAQTIQETKTPVTISENPHPLLGTWKMVYGEIREKDSLQVKDMSKSEFIKIINDSHFAFFNQEPGNFYGGGGTYSLNGDQYTETLSYTGAEEVRGHSFPFTIEIKGDSLIQYGRELVEEANMDRHIVEKYIRVK